VRRFGLIDSVQWTRCQADFAANGQIENGQIANRKYRKSIIGQLGGRDNRERDNVSKACMAAAVRVSTASFS
jgi:hypothetical protein